MVMTHFPHIYPQVTETRTAQELSGFWKIVFDYDNQGETVYGACTAIPDEAVSVAVPGSYNDQFIEKRVRDYVGAVWYYKEIVISGEKDRHNFLRFGSANYTAKVFLDGVYIGGHSGGHLPFTLFIPDCYSGKKVLLTVMVDNNLTLETIPPGQRCDYTVEKDGVSIPKLEYHFDFMHYCGLNRKVWLLSTPSVYTTDSTICTNCISEEGTATMSYDIRVHGTIDSVCMRLLYKGREVACVEDAGKSGTITVEKAVLWEVGVGGLHDWVIDLYRNGTLLDTMTERIGIRTVRLKGTQFLVNDKPVHFSGFCRHEDFHVFGRYLPENVLIRDFELMGWTGANSFRTSHYPYSEEHMAIADEQGFMVINETAAVGMNEWNNAGASWFDSDYANENSLINHKEHLRELIQRDKNRACVVMWSISNEASTSDKKARPYFKELVKLARSLDDRPLTNVSFKRIEHENCMDLFDVVCLNRYQAWYGACGDLETVEKVLGDELKMWYERFKMPLILSEYGADTIEGVHQLPSRMFSEEFQAEFLEEYHRVLAQFDFVIGEHVWNFADFMTKQEALRVVGNRKGVFTRERQPKMAAYVLRKLWKA